MKILVFGSLNIDDTYRVPHFLRAGETLSSSSYQKNAGGKGLNQALALARAGMQTFMGGSIGQDGLFLKDLLDSARVDTYFLRILSEPTGHAIISVDDQGQNNILLYGGANQMQDEGAIRETIRHFDKGDAILLQNEISCLPFVMRQAREKGMTVILNPSPMRDNLPPLLSMVDWLIFNEVEGADLTGETEPDRILSALLAVHPGCRLVLTLGDKGAIYADNQTRLDVKARKVPVVDTTAAGDTFTGYFFAEALQGGDIPRALRMASCAAGIAVSRPGAGASIPTREEVLTVLD